MLKDRIGNVLAAGQLVELTHSNQVLCYITEVKGGGIITGNRAGGSKLSPVSIVLAATFTFEYDPTNAVAQNLIRLVDPAKSEAENAPVLGESIN